MNKSKLSNIFAWFFIIILSFVLATVIYMVWIEFNNNLPRLAVAEEIEDNGEDDLFLEEAKNMAQEKYSISNIKYLGCLEEASYECSRTYNFADSDGNSFKVGVNYTRKNGLTFCDNYQHNIFDKELKIEIENKLIERFGKNKYVCSIDGSKTMTISSTQFSCSKDYVSVSLPTVTVFTKDKNIKQTNSEVIRIIADIMSPEFDDDNMHIQCKIYFCCKDGNSNNIGSIESNPENFIYIYNYIITADNTWTCNKDAFAENQSVILGYKSKEEYQQEYGSRYKNNYGYNYNYNNGYNYNYRQY